MAKIESRGNNDGSSSGDCIERLVVVVVSVVIRHMITVFHIFEEVLCIYGSEMANNFFQILNS